MHCVLTLIFGSLLVCSMQAAPNSDEIPGFFLKIAKNIPRVGRRSDPLFMKSLKNIPRIGRSVENQAQFTSKLLTWLHDDEGSHDVNKRRLLTPALSEREYSVVQPVNSNTLIELIEKDAIPTDNIKFVHWKDFDLALQFDAELYRKVMSLGRAPDQRLKNDLSSRFAKLAPWFEENGIDGNPEFLSFQQANPDDKYDSDFLHYNHL